MAGEEVVGGIVGFLRLDADDFHREITRAIAEVKVLKGMDARVRVEAVGARKAERDIAKVAASAKIAEASVGGLSSSFSRSGGGGLFSAPVIIGGIVTGMALLGPVTAAAAAAMAGFVGVAGTGLLAYQGFKKEIEDGTALGQVLQGQLDGIKSEFTALGTTAAKAMQGDVLAGLGDIRAFLPTINDEVEALAGHLGRAFRTSAGGLISGLENAMPLLEDGGKYAEILANKFADFTSSQDFKDFVDYARRELPNLGQAMVSLAGGIKDIAVSLAPAGDGLISIINLLGKVATGISWVIDGVTNLNNATQFPLMGGNNGDSLLGNLLGDTQDASAAIEDHTSKLETLTSIQSPLASALGITDTALQDAATKHRDTAAAALDATTQMQLEGDAAGLLKQSLDKLNGVNLSLAEAQSGYDRSMVNFQESQSSKGPSVSQKNAVANAQDRLATAKQRLAEGRAKGTKGAALQSLINGVASAERSLASAQDAVKKASSGADHSLKGTSKAAVDNRAQLINLAQGAQTVAEAYGQQQGSTEAGRQKLIEMRDQIIKNATATGMNKDEVTAFIDEILKVPAKVPPTKLEVEKTQAEKDLAAFQKAVDSLHGKTVTAGVRYAYTGRLPNGGRSLGGGQVMDAGATGGLIHNGIRRFDKGGLITGPGTGTSDSILARIASSGEPIRVANGEFLSTAAATQRNQAALEAGNRGATLGVVGQGGGMDATGMASVIARETAAAVYAGARDGIAGRESSLSLAGRRRRDAGYKQIATVH